MAERAGTLPSAAAALLALTLAGCGAYEEDVDVSTADIEMCPGLGAERTAIVFDEEGLSAAAPETATLAVWLREPAWLAVPACDGAAADDRKAGCKERDEVLDRRLAMSSEALECVLIEGLGLPDSLSLERALGQLTPVYWEDPYRRSDGMPVPILKAFSMGLTWPLIEQLSRHPYVERIEAPPGNIPFLGTQAPPAPEDCPAEREDPSPKLTELAALQGGSRNALAIRLSAGDVSDHTVSSCGQEPASCADLCDAFVFTEWERYLVSTRSLVCLLRELDAVVGFGEYPLDHWRRRTPGFSIPA